MALSQRLSNSPNAGDTYTASNIGEVANALGGDDVVNGGLGNDTINGNFGEDKIDGGAGQNILHGDEGNDYVSSIGNLNIAFGDRGADQLYFNGDQNQLFGGDTLFNDNDWLGVNGTNNALTGGFGDEVWIGASGNANTLNGDAGNDLLFANGFGNYLYGGIGADWLGVSGSFNVLQGQQGNDYVAATGNFNTLDGGAGNDTLLAGAHIGDRFVFHVGYGIDNIVNFARHGAGGIRRRRPERVRAQLLQPAVVLVRCRRQRDDHHQCRDHPDDRRRNEGATPGLGLPVLIVRDRPAKSRERPPTGGLFAFWSTFGPPHDAMLDRPPRPPKRDRQRANCERKRRERERRKAGEDVYRLSLCTSDVVEALIASGALSEGEALRRKSVKAALAAVLHQWATRWRR